MTTNPLYQAPSSSTYSASHEYDHEALAIKVRRGSEHSIEAITKDNLLSTIEKVKYIALACFATVASFGLALLSPLVRSWWDHGINGFRDKRVIDLNDGSNNEIQNSIHRKLAALSGFFFKNIEACLDPREVNWMRNRLLQDRVPQRPEVPHVEAQPLVPRPEAQPPLIAEEHEAHEQPPLGQQVLQQEELPLTQQQQTQPPATTENEKTLDQPPLVQEALHGEALSLIPQPEIQQPLVTEEQQNPTLVEAFPQMSRRDQVLDQIRENGLELRNVGKEYTKDKEIVLEAIRSNEESFEYADETLRQDVYFVLEVLQKINEWNKAGETHIDVRKLLPYVDQAFLNDQEVAVSILQNIPNEFEKASILEKHLHKELRENQDFIKSLIPDISTQAIKYLKDSDPDYERLARSAFDKDHSVFKYLSTNLRSEKDLALKAVEYRGGYHLFIGNSLKQDPDIVKIIKNKNQNQ